MPVDNPSRNAARPRAGYGNRHQTRNWAASEGSDTRVAHEAGDLAQDRYASTAEIQDAVFQRDVGPRGYGGAGAGGEVGSVFRQADARVARRSPLHESADRQLGAAPLCRAGRTSRCVDEQQALESRRGLPPGLFTPWSGRCCRATDSGDPGLTTVGHVVKARDLMKQTSMLMRPAATTRQVLHATCRRLKRSQQISSAHVPVEITFKSKAVMLTHRTAAISGRKWRE